MRYSLLHLKNDDGKNKNLSISARDIKHELNL